MLFFFENFSRLWDLGGAIPPGLPVAPPLTTYIENSNLNQAFQISPKSSHLRPMFKFVILAVRSKTKFCPVLKHTAKALMTTRVIYFQSIKGSGLVMSVREPQTIVLDLRAMKNFNIMSLRQEAQTMLLKWPKIWFSNALFKLTKTNILHL